VSPRPCKRQISIWLRFDHSTARNVTLTSKILELPSYHLNTKEKREGERALPRAPPSPTSAETGGKGFDRLAPIGGHEGKIGGQLQNDLTLVLYCV
jgi:hypothetical protein